MNASRRTRKVNAYVSGIGSTRRVVLYDTLLDRVAQPELEIVVAHELGHRHEQHVAKGTVLAMLGAVAGTLVVWAVLPNPQDPAIAPKLLLVTGVLELLVLPFEAALSRRWERVADRFSLELTSDRDAFRSAFGTDGSSAGRASIRRLALRARARSPGAVPAR